VPDRVTDSPDHHHGPGPLPCLAGPRPFVMAHRGFDLAGLENSMRAFEAAVRLGVDFLETDVRATADGVLLAFHDARLRRVTGLSGRVATSPWSRLRRARIRGVEPIPLLAEVLHAWPEMRVNVDIKAPGAIRPFVEVVRRAKARERVCVASFSDRRRAAAVAGLSDEGPVAWSPGVRGIAGVVAAVRRGDPVAVRRAVAGAGCVQLPGSIGGVPVVTAGLVDALHAVGAQVHVWTVDDPERMRRLVDCGVDGIVTNRADLAVQVVRERGRGAGS
jgi:glycerophosphoryl diester phosphodiesterase